MLFRRGPALAGTQAEACSLTGENGTGGGGVNRHDRERCARYVGLMTRLIFVGRIVGVALRLLLGLRAMGALWFRKSWLRIGEVGELRNSSNPY